MFLQILSPIKKAITLREKLTKYDVPRCVKTVILLPLKVEGDTCRELGNFHSEKSI